MRAVKALVSVIVTTYRRPDALAAVLRGLSSQSDDRFEVIVGDDGSGDATASVVKEAQASMKPQKIVHAWQPDDGFRAARVRNLAVQAASGTVLVFLDGDCIPRKHFVLAHRCCRLGRVVRGSRCLLSQAMTDRVLQERLPVETYRAIDWMAARRRGDVNRLPAMAGSTIGRVIISRSWKLLRSCNMSVHRDDFMAVDGFDQAYEGWGYEDSDLAVRLLAHGCGITRATARAAVLHLWHQEADRSQDQQNRRRLHAVRASGRIKAESGFSVISGT